MTLNEICWCASFVCWPNMFLVLHLLRSFLKYLCEHPRVRLTVWKLMCWICLHPRVRLKFYVRLTTHLKLTLKKCRIFFSDPSEIFQASWNDWSSFHSALDLWLLSSLKMMQRSPNRSSYCWNFRQNGKRNLEKICFAFQTGKHVLDIDSWNHSDATMKDLWQRFF